MRRERSLFGFGIAAIAVHAIALGMTTTTRARAHDEPAPVSVEIEAAATAKAPELPSEPHGDGPASAPAARAAAVITTKSEPAAKRSPVSFVSDPYGDEYGTGTVAVGGTATIGSGSTTTPPPPPPAASAPPPPPPPPPVPPAPIAKPTVDLSQRPRLDEPNACKGFFPSMADDDAALVTVEVLVRPDGEVASAIVMHEEPNGQGFGAAARKCLLGKRFTPGLDVEGRPTSAKTRVNVRFVR